MNDEKQQHGEQSAELCDSEDGRDATGTRFTS